MTPAEEQFVIRLAEEYKILQDKIDKIGAFRFTIKGWSITVIIGALFAGSATSLRLTMSLVLSAALLVLILAFFAFERQQTRLSHHFGERAISIERVISRILRKDSRASGADDFLVLRFVPGIAHHLRRRHSRSRGPRSLWRSLHEADIGFYFMEVVLVCAVVLGHSLSIPASNDIVIKGATHLNIMPAAEGGNIPSGKVGTGNHNTPTSTTPENAPAIKNAPSIPKHK